jgi:hypothetical protein
MLQDQKKEYEEKISKLEKEKEKVLDIAHNNSKSVETSMNILKYAKLNFNDAEPFEGLKGNDIYEVMNYNNPKNIESINEEYVKIAIHKYNHNIFHAFIGDMIIEHYKPKSKKDVNFIATDTSRLCFIIMQEITKKGKIQKKEWINDKSGAWVSTFCKKVLISTHCKLIRFFYLLR